MNPVVPPGAAPAGPDSSFTRHSESGSSGNHHALMIVRGCTWVFALIAFSVTASIENYASMDALNFVIAMGVIDWVYSMVIVGNYLASKYANLELMPIDMIENKFAGPMDLLLLFLTYTATICASVESTQFTTCGDISDVCAKMHTSAFFMWFTTFTIMATIYIRDPEAVKRMIKGLGSERYQDIDSQGMGGGATPKKTVDL